jgi:hypothetical protein
MAEDDEILACICTFIIKPLKSWLRNRKILLYDLQIQAGICHFYKIVIRSCRSRGVPGRNGADELINDDDLFNAALVSCGTFGVVHAFVIQTEKLFTLEPQVRKFSFSQAKEALYSLDIASLDIDLDNPLELPWHFEFYLNPYQLEQKGGCIVRIMQKSPLTDMKLDEIKAGAATYTPTYYGQDLMVAMGNVVNQRLLDLVQLFGYDFIGASVRRFIFGIISQAGTILLMQPGDLKDGEAAAYPL